MLKHVELFEKNRFFNILIMLGQKLRRNIFEIDG